MAEQDFAGRADAAAEVLKARLGLPVSKVQVGPNGELPQAPPPPGSYAALEIEEQNRQLREQRATPAVEEPPVQPAQPSADEPTADPPSVQQRISDLARQRREEAQRRQEAEQQLAQEREARERERRAYEAERQRFLSQHLDSLDPDTRNEILRDAKMHEIASQASQQVLNELLPHVRDLSLRDRHREMRALASRYPLFDFESHGQLIEDVLAKNPALSPEQAWRAIATDEELGIRQQASPRVPQIVSGPGTQSLERTSLQASRTRQDEDRELREEAKRLYQLKRSSNPDDRREAERLQHRHLMRRLGG